MKRTVQMASVVPANTKEIFAKVIPSVVEAFSKTLRAMTQEESTDYLWSLNEEMAKEESDW